MNYKLSYYQEKLDSKTLNNEFIFYLKEKLFFNDKDIYLNKDRELSAEEQNLIQDFIEKKKEGMPLDLSLIHISEPRDQRGSRMPSSA